MKNCKKKTISFIFVFILIFNISCFNCYADGMSITTVSAIAYAIAQDAGLNFNFSNTTSSFSEQWMQSQVNTYLDGDSIANKFGSDLVRAAAGKLIVPATVYNGVKTFLDWLINEKNIEQDTVILPGEIEGIVIDNLNTESTAGELTVDQYIFEQDETYNRLRVSVYRTGQSSTIASTNSAYIKANFEYSPVGWQLVQDGSSYRVAGIWNRKYISSGKVDFHTTRTGTFKLSGNITNSMQADSTSYDDYNLDVGYQWEGTIDGTAPDTNLDQLVGDIFDLVAIDDLDITSETHETTPTPTPIPTYQPVDDVIDGLNTGIEIGNDIIAGQAAQTGAITGAVEGVRESVESVAETVESIVETPNAQELPDFKFDLRELFPFCIPFDIYRLLSSFDAEPQAPHVQLPIVIDSINFQYNLDLDFSAWNPVAQAMRTAELIVYAIGLAWATGKVIKW